MSLKPPPSARGESRDDYRGPDGAWRPSRPEGLARVVAKAGYGSRARAEAMVREGRLAVDGQVVSDPGHAVDATSHIALDGSPLVEAPRRYYAFHKQATAEDAAALAWVLPRLPDDVPGLEPVGRLDRRTAGLVLLSNDHWWNTAIQSRRRLEREFVARVRGELNDAELGIIRGGLQLQGMGHVRPLEVQVLARDAAATEVRLALRGAKIRQVRQLFVSFRHEVLDLAVVRVGAVRLGDLPAGRFRPLTRAEIQAMRD